MNKPNNVNGVLSSVLFSHLDTMNKDQEPKYMIVATTDGCRLANRASEEVIPSDEPVMIFRARDRHD